MNKDGSDTDGGEYKNVAEMWKSQLANGEEAWYGKAAEYWETQEVSVNGVLGGYAHTSGTDIRESLHLLDTLRKGKNPPEFGRALDMGAGIGRVAEGMLLQRFQAVDLVEPCEKYLTAAKENLGRLRTADGLPRCKDTEFFLSALQDFTPAKGRYDVIWNQWVLLYLTDDHLVEFLKRCKEGLREGGVICVKENTVLQGKFVVDKEDNSITRTGAQYKEIFKRAGLKLVMEMRQTCWPPDLFPVMMYVVR